ncbi:MAG: parvulin-like peptidyl-prolyl isomerase [Lysobacterales bacterium]|jgi:parvulin-like peptidyl-prolyl isomerase
MKKIAYSLLLFLSILTLFLPTQTFALEDGILAVVNDELITLNDLKHYIKTTHLNLATQKYHPEQIRQYMKELENKGLEKLIEDKLILSNSNEIGLTVRKEAVDERLNEYKTKYASEEAFMEALLTHGGTITDMRNKIEEQLKIQYVIDHSVRSKIYVNPQEITDYYNANKEKFAKKESITLDSIFISASKDSSGAKAQDALNKIKAGGDFKVIAETYSETPAVGRVEKGQLMSDIEDVIFALDIEEVSQIVTTDTGLYIFKALKKTPGQVAELSEVKPFIKDKVFDDKFRVKFQEWLTELKNNAYIEIKK